MRRLLFLSFLCCAAPVLADPQILTAEAWMPPRSGEALTRVPALMRTIETFERQADGVIVIRHSADAAGQVWADECRSWLVALGISSAHIKLDARVDVRDVLILDVTVRENL